MFPKKTRLTLECNLGKKGGEIWGLRAGSGKKDALRKEVHQVRTYEWSKELPRRRSSGLLGALNEEGRRGSPSEPDARHRWGSKRGGKAGSPAAGANRQAVFLVEQQHKTDWNWGRKEGPQGTCLFRGSRKKGKLHEGVR